jgi:hypothetical protein
MPLWQRTVSRPDLATKSPSGYLGFYIEINIKEQSKNSWARVSFVWYLKRVLFFESAEGNFNELKPVSNSK